MSTKALVIGLVIVILIGGGLYYYFAMMQPAPAENLTTGAQEQQIPSDQVQGQDVTVGTGAEAMPGSHVSVLYEGRLQNGTVFDSSAAHNNEPLVFVLGAQGLIPGFQIGVNGMKEGGERVILIPPELAYGAQDVTGADGKVLIPANSPLVFSLKLVKVEPAPKSSEKGSATE